MEFLRGTANPDNLKVKTENGKVLYNTNCDSPLGRPVPFIFGVDPDGNLKCWLGRVCEYHYQLSNYSDIAMDYIDGRLWKDYKIICV